MARRAGKSPFDGVREALEKLAVAATEWSGRSSAFLCAAGAIVVWAASGPLFGWSDTWQLVINTATTIVTFLMVFLIQRAQNKDGRAIQLKLNEIVAAIEGASNQLIDVESLSEDEIRTLHRHFAKLSEMADEDADVGRSHSIAEAESRHEAKSRGRASTPPGGRRRRH